MLAELLQLRRNLEKQGISIERSHPDLHKPGLSGFETFKAVLDNEGKIRLQPLLNEEIPGLWTLKNGNKNFFPAVRLDNPPLILDASDDYWQFLKKPKLENLHAVLDRSENRIQKIDLSGIWKGQAARILSWTCNEPDPAISKLKAFALAFQKLSENPELVAQEIIRAVRSALDSPVNDKLLKSLIALLVGSRKESRNKPPSLEYKIQLCFDFSPNDEPSFTLYTASIKRAVLECLNSESSANPEKQDTACAITGEYIPLLSEPYPDWSAPPVISKPLKPFSKFSEAPCNYRYHRADSDGFPIGQDTASELVSAIKTVTEQFKGRAWCSLRNGKIEERNGRKVEAQDVLIAYPSFPLEHLAVVNIFAKPEINSEETEEEDDDDTSRAIKRFGDLAAPVCKAFRKKINTEQIRPYLILLLIRQISPGQIQLAYSATPSIQHFIYAVDTWSASGNNLPERLRVPLLSKKSETGFRWFTPFLLFPEDISRLLSHQWIRDGTENTRLDGPPVGMVLDFFLRKPGVWEQCANHLLELTLSRCGVLLVQAGNRLHRDDPAQLKYWRDFINHSKGGGSDPRYHYAQTLSLIGSLLFAMNSKVESYTNESAYMVGKLLAMADKLHMCYCEVVRDGDVPNALIGNGLLGRAAESPARALEELLDRIRIYIGWAKSVDVDKAPQEQKIAIYSAMKVLRLAEPLAEKLHLESGLENELPAVSKAHLLLGYLSPVLGKEESGSGKEGDNDSAQDQAKQ
jgi:hypothetical protein